MYSVKEIIPKITVYSRNKVSSIKIFPSNKLYNMKIKQKVEKHF